MGGVFSSNLTEAACVVHLFKINGYSATRAMCRTDSLPSKRLAVGGYEWEVHYTPSHGHNWIVFKLILLGAPRRRDVKAALRCRLVSPNSNQQRQRQRRDANQYEDQICHAFTRAKESSGWAQLCTTSDLEASGAVKDDDFTVECTITVIAEPGDRAANDVHVLLPSSGLHHHLGELLQNGTGTDVSFAVSGQLFAAHKAILASRSPVFMAQFFGRMKEEDTKRVEVEDMFPAVFGAMLHFIYTDSAPELDQQDCAVVAQHLLAAADRYGLDRLKLMCEYKLLDGIGINTEATTLALAEQHNCLHLKAKCVELIVANLDAVMATKGYRHLMESCPEVMNDLLKAVSGRNN